MIRRTDALAGLAAGSFVLALAGLGAAMEGYSQALHPPALLGAQQQPWALAFNLFGFALPGVLGALVMIALRGRLDGARWAPRIGSWLWLLSAVAFAAQGLLPLDLTDIDAPIGHLHASAWTLWWLAFVPGGVLIALGAGPAGRAYGSLRVAAIVAAMLLPLFTLYAPLGLPAGASQRIGLALWFAAMLVAGVAARRPPQR
ncbi:MAG: DUF998 domain-containing protein [Lysobacter sp.]|nr:DUF998 domain-containing protein [Lysobacter sp.]